MENTNQYPIWIGLFGAMVMVCVMANPEWWMIAVLGIGANGLVMAANGWKMPVRESIEETIGHRPMSASTRHKWLADIIPTGVGKASIGDILLAAGVLGAVATRSSLGYIQLMAVLCLAWWASGWVKGFRLLDKWTAEARRDSRKNIPIVLMLMVVGNLLHVRGCSVGELHASANRVESAIASTQSPKVNIKPESKWRDLGTVAAPPPEILTRLREDSAKREREKKEEAAVQAVTTFTFTTVSPKSNRSGPFCRVTCSAHHGGEYDVETIPDLCRSNWIPPTTSYVPGWYALSDKYETTKPWPGPAQQGFEKYKLYWSSLQSEAKVVHRASEETR